MRPPTHDVSTGENLLIAMPHRNTNDSRKDDFVTSGGEADPPYVDSEDTNGDGMDVVVDTATVPFDTPRGGRGH